MVHICKRNTINLFETKTSIRNNASNIVTIYEDKFVNFNVVSLMISPTYSGEVTHDHIMLYQIFANVTITANWT